MSDETEETAQEIRDDINRIAGIGQTIEKPGFFTKDELEGIAEYIIQKEGDRSDE
jgi:hypothetical protein